MFSFILQIYGIYASYLIVNENFMTCFFIFIENGPNFSYLIKILNDFQKVDFFT